MYARPFINSLDFAGNGREISGEVAIAELPRLQDVLNSTQDMLSYAIRGGMDKQHGYFLDVQVTGTCQLRCQRCLGGMDHLLRLDVRLLLRNQASLDALDDHAAVEEAFDSILAEAHLDVLGLLEEEILLSLPIAPKHELGACQVADGTHISREEKNPFAVLAKLKGRL